MNLLLPFTSCFLFRAQKLFHNYASVVIENHIASAAVIFLDFWNIFGRSRFLSHRLAGRSEMSSNLEANANLYFRYG